MLNAIFYSIFDVNVLNDHMYDEQIFLINIII